MPRPFTPPPIARTTSTPLAAETSGVDAERASSVPAAAPVPAQVLVAVPCAECGAPVDARFCGRCGERRLEARDFSIGALIAHALQNLANFDGRLLHTVRDLIVRPGRLTADYMSGRRNRQTQPLTLFLTINVLFFVAIANSNIMRWPLRQYEQSMAILPVSSAMVRSLATERAAAEGMTRDAFAGRFDGALRDRQKATLVILVPLFAAVVGLATWGLRRPAVQHLVFAIHFYAFYLLWFGFGVRGLIWGLYYLLRPFGDGALAPVSALGSEAGLTFLIIGGATLYLRPALGCAYAIRPPRAWLTALALGAVVATLFVWLLRDLMFFFTLYTV